MLMSWLAIAMIIISMVGVVMTPSLLVMVMTLLMGEAVATALLVVLAVMSIFLTHALTPLLTRVERIMF